MGFSRSREKSGVLVVSTMIDAAGSCAGTGAIGCVRIINKDVPNESNTHLKASSRDLLVLFINSVNRKVFLQKSNIA